MGGDLQQWLGAVRSAGSTAVSEPEEETPAQVKPPRPDAKPGPYITTLSPEDEKSFRTWAADPKNNSSEYVTPNPKADYDARGFWKAMQSGDPIAKRAMSAADGKLHAPDVWKTPYHRSFSAESKYALPTAPKWNDRDQLLDSTGKVVWDDRDPEHFNEETAASPKQDAPEPDQEQSLDEMLKAVRAVGPSATEAATRAHVTPSETPGAGTLPPEFHSQLNQQAEDVGKPLVPPLTPPGGAPSLVRGPFGQPIPPVNVQQQLDAETQAEQQRAQVADQAREQQVIAGNESPEARFAGAMGQPPPTVPPGIVSDALARSVPGVGGQGDPALAQTIQNIRGQRPPLEAMVNPLETGLGAQFARGAATGASGLFTPDNIALAGGMEALPGPAKAVLGQVFTYYMAKGLVQNAELAVKAAQQKDWGTLAKLAGEAIPESIFTVEGVRNVFEGSQRVAEGLRERGRARAGAEAANMKGTVVSPEGEVESGPEQPEQQPENQPKLAAESEEMAQERRQQAKTLTVEPQAATTEEAQPGVPEEPEAPPARSAAPAQAEPEPEAAKETPQELPQEPPAEERPRGGPTTEEVAPEEESSVPMELPSHDELADKITERTGDRQFADRRATSLLEAAQGHPGYAGPERRLAETLIPNYMGPERRGVKSTEQEPESVQETEQPLSREDLLDAVREAEPEQTGNELETTSESTPSNEGEKQEEAPAAVSNEDSFKEAYRAELAKRLVDRAGTVGYNWRDKSPEAVAKFVDGIVDQVKGGGDYLKDNETLRAVASSFGIKKPKQLREFLAAAQSEVPTAPPTEPINIRGEEAPAQTGYRYSEVSPSADKWNNLGAQERSTYLQRAGVGFSVSDRPWDKLGKRAQKSLSDVFAQEAEVPTDYTTGGVPITGEHPQDVSGPLTPETQALYSEARESDTLPPEAPADEQPTESLAGEERAEPADEQPVGEAGGESLEGVSPEDVRGTSEERPVEGESDTGSDADRGRSAELSGRGDGSPERVGDGEGQVSVPAERGRRAEPGREPGQLTTGHRAGNDYHITEADGIGSGGIKTKYRANVAAIRTLKAIEDEGRQATPEEQRALVKYTGWGGIASNQLFNPETTSWASEHQELKALLTPDEYRRARASTTNAHYTSLPVVSGIWDGIARLGFTDGSLLEPSAGIGHFLGIEPPDLATNTRRTAVELDPISGRILKQLYQSADVRIQNFGDFNAPNDTYDMAVGNVPFGKITVNDPAYNKHHLSIHNYFILKTLDKLRPGGIAALITSAHTMDTFDNKHLKLFQSRADLLGAIRLPNDAFKGNAGTEVTTDILFFKKRGEDEAPAGQPFLSQKEITSQQGNKMRVNEYFADHPEMMLGDMELAGKMRRAGEPALIAKPGQDLKQALADAIAKLPENAMGERKVPESTTMEASADGIPDFKEMKQYGLAVKGNKVYRRVDDSVQSQPDYPKTSINALKKLLDVRDGARELLKAEVTDRPQDELADLRRRLNEKYDRFVDKNGIIHSPRNRRLMHADPDLPLLLSLENYDAQKKKAEKAAIFSTRVVSPTRTITKADNAKDAMLVSLADKGHLDFDHMATLTGKSPEMLQNELREQGLIFHAPDGHWETSDMYLSGNVRKKLAEAEEAAQTNEEFQANADALRAIIPEDLPPSKIAMRLGASWLPTPVVKDFIAHILGASDTRNIALKHNVGDAKWDMDAYAPDPVANRTTWGTSHAPATWLIEKGLNLQVPTVWKDLGDGKKAIDQKQTTAAEDKLSAINKELHRWMFEDSPHAVDMARRYNDLFNSTVEWHPDGSHLTLPGSNPEIQLRPYQKNGIWRAVAGKTNTLLSWEVGMGKSFPLIGTAMEWRRLGLKKKPMLVIPTNLVEQFRQDFLKMYPMANVLAAEKASFETMNRKEFMQRIQTGDWDAVIVGDSQFGMLPAGSSAGEEAMSDMLDLARANLAEAEAGKDRRTVKEIETQIANMEAQIDKLRAEEKKDDITPFNELGVDGLLVDEAHRMKSLYFPTKMGRVRGVPQSRSKRAMDTYIKARYLTKINNGNGVVFSTGTPITNTIAEAWIMSKFLDEAALKEMGMNHFDAWAANFGNSVSKAEGYPENPSKLRMVTRFSEFNNVYEAARLFRRVADIRFADDEKLERPKMTGGKMEPFTIQPSSELLDYIQSLVERAQKARGKKPEKGADNMLVITGDGRKAAIDMRMVDSNASDDPDSKLNQATREVASTYHATRENKSTQLVMLDLRQGEGGFDAYHDIRKKLIGLGVPKDQIAFIQDYKSSAAKQGLFNKVNSGDMAVVLGSSDTLGIGVNVQRRLHSMHHIDAPWRPDWVEQRNGRGIRFGNMNKEVRVVSYITKKSFDKYMWELLKRKNNARTQFLKADKNVRTIEDVSGRAFNAAEIEAAASDDPRLYRKMELEDTTERLQSLAQSFQDRQFDNRTKLARIPEQIDQFKKNLANTEADMEARDAMPEDFSMVVGKKHFDDRKAAGAALNAVLQNHSGAPARVGSLGPFDIYAGENRAGYIRGKGSLEFKMGKGEANEKGEVEPSPMGTIMSIESSLRGLDKRVAMYRENISKLISEKSDRQEKAGETFDRQQELTDSTAELAKLNKDLGLDNPENKNMDEGEGGDPKEEDEEDEPDDLTQSFLGLQNAYNRIARIIRRARRARASDRVAQAAAGGPPAGEPPEPPGSIPLEPPGEEPQNPSVERAGNIRLDKLNTSDDVLNLIRETSKVHSARINAQRRGRLSDKDLKKRMEEVGLDPEKLAKLKKGTALNEAELQVAIGIMLDKGDQVREAQTKAQEDNSTQNLLRAQQLHNEYVAIQAAVSGAKAESGRALRIQRMISDAFRTQERSNYEKTIEALGGRKLAEKEAQKLLQIPQDDVIGYHRFLRDHAKFTTPQMVVAYWVNNILSGPGTIQRKLLGDAAMSAMAVPERVLRSVIDPALAAVQGRKREFYLRDAMAQNLAYFGAIPDGIKAGSFMLAHGFDLQDAAELDLPIRYELPGGLATNWPTRLLAGATAMFKVAHKRAALHGLALREGLKEGLSGDALAKRAADLAGNPTEEMNQKAMDEANELALVSKPGAFTQGLLRVRNTTIPGTNFAPLNFVFPFVTVGANIAKQAFRHSPAGLGRFIQEDVRKGPEGSKVIAQALIGTLIMGAFAAWWAQKNMTGKAPTSAQDRDAFFRSGKQPFSIKVGNRWVSYTKGWGPLGLMAATVVGWGEAQEKSDHDFMSEIGDTAGALLNGMQDQSFFRGMQNLSQAVSEPDRYGAQFISEIASGFIPFSGFDRAFADALDPEIRTPEGIYERVAAGLPVLSKSVPPRLDVLGRPTTRRGGEGAKAFLPTPIPEDNPESEVDAELGRLHDLGLRNPGFTAHFLTVDKTKIPLSRPERNEYQRLRGQLLDIMLQRIFSSDDYRELPDQEKVEATEQSMRQVEDYARNAMISRIIEKRTGHPIEAQDGVPMEPSSVQ